jgi:hypothetical protein
MSEAIPDFTDAEREAVGTRLPRRYGQPTPIELADAETSLKPRSDETTLGPTLHWPAGGARFVVFKTGERARRCLFFHGDADRYGTGRETRADPRDCATTLLRLNVPLVSAVARTAAAWAGIAR